MKNIKNVLLVLSVITIFLLSNYIQYVQYTEQLREDSRKLMNNFFIYSMETKSYQNPRSKKDVEKMFSWLRETTPSKKSEFNFLKYGYNVKYDSINDSSTIYCFGKNKKDDKLINTNGNAYLFLTNKSQIVTLDFFDYYFNRSNDDIIILDLYYH